MHERVGEREWKDGMNLRYRGIGVHEYFMNNDSA